VLGQHYRGREQVEFGKVLLSKIVLVVYLVGSATDIRNVLVLLLTSCNTSQLFLPHATLAVAAGQMCACKVLLSRRWHYSKECGYDLFKRSLWASFVW
jgi:hypothetical protein